MPPPETDILVSRDDLESTECLTREFIAHVGLMMKQVLCEHMEEMMALELKETNKQGWSQNKTTEVNIKQEKV